MELFETKECSQLEQFLLTSRDENRNVVIVTMSGLGIGYLVEKIAERNKGLGVKAIYREGEALGSYNLLDIDFQRRADAVEIVDDYFKKANSEQKFAVVINSPSFMETEQYKNSYVASHVYGLYWHRAAGKQYIEVMVGQMERKIDVDKIYELSGGVARIAKVLILKPYLVGEPMDTIMKDEDICLTLESVSKSVESLAAHAQEKLGIKKGEHWQSKLLQCYWEVKRKLGQISAIQIRRDLTVNEGGEISREHLTKQEAEILQFMLRHEGVIEKEKVSEIKWGEGSYDKYSDQAIAKTMQRLEKKLALHEIEAVTGFGYKLIAKTHG